MCFHMRIVYYCENAYLLEQWSEHKCAFISIYYQTITCWKIKRLTFIAMKYSSEQRDLLLTWRKPHIYRGWYSLDPWSVSTLLCFLFFCFVIIETYLCSTNGNWRNVVQLESVLYITRQMPIVFVPCQNMGYSLCHPFPHTQDMDQPKILQSYLL